MERLSRSRAAAARAWRRSKLICGACRPSGQRYPTRRECRAPASHSRRPTRRAHQPRRRRIAVVEAAFRSVERAHLRRKTHEHRSVIRPGALAAKLGAHLAGVEADGFVFTRRGGPQRSAAWRTTVASGARRLRIDNLRIHDLHIPRGR